MASGIIGLVTQSVPVPSHALEPLSFRDLRLVWQPWATSNPLSPTSSLNPLFPTMTPGPALVWREDQGLSGQWVTGQWQGRQADETCSPQMCPPCSGGYLGQEQRCGQLGGVS